MADDLKLGWWFFPTVYVPKNIKREDYPVGESFPEYDKLLKRKPQDILKSTFDHIEEEPYTSGKYWAMRDIAMMLIAFAAERDHPRHMFKRA